MSFATDCVDTIGVCNNRLFTLSVGQCTEADLVLQLIDPRTGELVDLTKYGLGGSSSSSSSSSGSLADCWCGVPCLNDDGTPKNGVEIILKEMPNSPLYLYKMAVILTEADAQNGLVHIATDKVMTEKAGVWLGMAVIWQNGVQRRHFPFYMDITPNLAVYNPSGPLTMVEVRMLTRDVCAEANFLIDQVEYKDEEIAFMIRRPIDEWNETPPPIGRYTPMTFPYRYHWGEAVIGELLRMASLWLRRNDLDYSAAGLTVADTKKWPDYYRVGQELGQKWRLWMRNKKAEINLAGAYGSMGGYPTRWW